MRILLVEDDDAVREVIAELLRDLGHAVAEASTLALANRTLADETRDAIVVDALLPDGKGIDVAHQAAARRVGLLLISGHPEQIDILMASGFRFLSKPLTSTDLIADIEFLRANA